ncbi:MAG: thioredoxin domain-containing protein [Candidatus Pacebacteria bacterium]|nr:thioredoxin domain-containing protein [Candidatus Paceibacterota bacterium]
MPKNLELSPSVSILIAGVLIAGAIIFVNLNANAAQAPAGDGALPGNTSVPAPGADDHIIGSPQAPIVLIEYLDFQCVYCSLVHPTLKRLVEESDGQVAWVMRHLPLESIHPEARPSGLAAECIAEQLGNAGWWAFADDMMANQEGMGTARYLGLAAQLGADTAQYMSCVSSNKYSQKIDEHAAEAQVAGAQGTPYTVVYGNGAQVPLSGALPYEQFAAVIKAVQARQ